MTTGTSSRRSSGAARRQPTSLLGELRELAGSAPARAGAACWDYLRGAADTDDRELLAALFAQGTAPQLDGDYEGMIAGKLFGIPEAALLNPVVAVEPGWVGKSFDAATATGYNRLNRIAYLALRAAVPRYSGWVRTSAVYQGFRFGYRVERASLAPFVQVAAVTYTDPALGNPRSRIVPIERVRDELVELVPGVYLGRALMGSRTGEIRVIGYFALRAPLRETNR
ncbi:MULTISPECIES: hypothetical protein [Nocardia]|uniref:hypothetical protein n=1 Tax=Nocardia TaxID=1817 RepID=UPI0007E9661C|nr:MULTISPECIES: hypothetical protein [Nocardia]MBF6278156.1 hypothetical protein [Nocardia nova]OBA53224.1 hypothetical protein A5789_24780 [Nocardia sp. 852002-51101_SCH5132738]OBB51220.1 hypothetical protein A5748_16945 [Nocardia sp. 852002-51244_SCH5132740]OBF81695.1 hypothetical protein A9X06_00610 [Mycobacterium sp. 852002-51759_SCH5129042]